jgi:hypothetical protein
LYFRRRSHIIRKPMMAKAATPIPAPIPAAAPVLSPCADELGVEPGLLVLVLVAALVLMVDLDGEVVVIVATVEVDGAEV